jgi:hypothetical protein
MYLWHWDLRFSRLTAKLTRNKLYTSHALAARYFSYSIAGGFSETRRSFFLTPGEIKY